MKRIFALLLVLCVVLSLTVSATAGELQHNYSTSANSGIRHEVCTSLEGTSVDSYYTGSYSYDQLTALSGNALLMYLRELMTETHTHTTSYANCRDYAVKTDCENGDGQTINLIYISYSATMSDYLASGTGGWNREHVWPKSLGGFDTAGAGADLHHIRPSNMSVNSSRGNLKYGYADSGKSVYGGSLLGGYSSTYFEPLDNVKGDVARICLYVYVRYGGELSKCSNITNVFQSVDVLLEWCALDPVDTWEMGRNEVVSAIQGNRNVFIDYPELAWLLFNAEIPEDMVTPSGGNSNTSNPTEPTEPEPTETEPVCTHSKTTVENAVAATCGKKGYSGDTYCQNCGVKLATGAEMAPTEQHSYGEWVISVYPTHTTEGLRERECTVCSYRESESIPTTETPDEGQTEPVETEPLDTEPEETVIPADPTETATEPAETAPPTSLNPTEGTEPADDPNGPNSYLWIIIVLVVVAAACVVIVIPKGRKSKS